MGRVLQPRCACCTKAKKRSVDKEDL
jgi:hypothetical protein